MPVETVLGQSDVVLLGPDGSVVKSAPAAADLYGKGDGYWLDFPGDPLHAGCSYEEWFDRIAAGKPTTAYAHVVERAGAARAPVLVLLPLQRLEQQARERLGDDPARLRRRHGRRRRSTRRPRSSATRSTRAPRARPGTTRSSRSATGTRSSTRAQARTPTSSSSRCTSGTARRPDSAVTTRAGRPTTSRRRSCCCRPRRPGRTTRSPGSATSGTGGSRSRGRTAGRPAPRSRASGPSRSPGSTRSGGPTTCRSRPRARSRRRRPASSAPTVAKGSEIYIRFLRNPFLVLAILAAIGLLAVWLSRRTNWSPGPAHSDPAAARRR